MPQAKKKSSKKTTKKTAAKKTAAKKKVTKKTAVKKTATKKAAKKTAVKKTVAKKAAKKTVVKKTVHKTAAKKTAKKTVAKKAAKPVHKTQARKPVKKTTAKSTIKKGSTATATKSKARPVAAPLLLDTGAMLVSGFKPYQLAKDEEYMSSGQIEHFRDLLNAWKRDLLEEAERTVHHMQDEAANFPDPTDRATQESEFSLELRARDRERMLIKKINEALSILGGGEYGYCETCGVEIGIRRLEARPTANKCIDCKELDEIKEKQFG